VRTESPTIVRTAELARSPTSIHSLELRGASRSKPIAPMLPTFNFADNGRLSLGGLGGDSPDGKGHARMSSVGMDVLNAWSALGGSMAGVTVGT